MRGDQGKRECTKAEEGLVPTRKVQVGGFATQPRQPSTSSYMKFISCVSTTKGFHRHLSNTRLCTWTVAARISTPVRHIDTTTRRIIPFTHKTMSTEPSIRPTTIIAAVAGTLAAGVAAYAVYFDYRRRSDPEFRRSLKRASKAQAKASKVQEEKADAERKIQIRQMVKEVNDTGVPRDPEEVEKYFMDEVAEGELLCQDRKCTSQPP